MTRIIGSSKNRGSMIVCDVKDRTGRRIEYLTLGREALRLKSIDKMSCFEPFETDADAEVVLSDENQRASLRRKITAYVKKWYREIGEKPPVIDMFGWSTCDLRPQA